MVTWKEFSIAVPEIASYGKARFTRTAAYLGTLRADGSPRVHPVTPIISEDHLFLFMEPTSPKGKDLLRDGRYTLHCGVEDTAGGNGEFYVRGTAYLIADRAIRQEAIEAATYNPASRYILFTFGIDFAFQNLYIEGKSRVTRWSATE